MKIKRLSIQCDACTCLDRNGYIIILNDTCTRELLLCENCANRLFEAVKEMANEERPI